MRVLAARRTYAPGERLSHVDEVFPLDRLNDMLSRCDYVVVAVSLTPETRGLVGKEALAAMKRGAYLINVARGPIVDQSALIDSLKRGHLSGAALDVFETEPLPEESPLWAMSNVLITPHNTGGFISHVDKLTALFCDNLRRYLDGKPLLNQVNAY
jgi:phosphoglycerate dehydrogenase-like enzyme